MSEKQQTAVEWLFDNLDLSGGSEAIETLNKAKKMEKEQIINAYEVTKFGIFAMTDTGILDTANKSGEQYYNETFKSE